MADDFFSRHFPPKPPILKIGKEINRGAYGTVYEGEMNENPVAVKKIHRVLLETSLQQGATTILDSFKNECALLEKADNVHVVRFHGAYYDEESQEPILVMEKLHQNLSEYLSKNRGKLDRLRQIQISLEIVNGVLFLHSLVPPVIHRDLNDKNVMLSEEGLVKVGDLGQSRLKEANVDYFSTGQPGAVPFMPPEALQEAAHYDEKIDTFSIGVLMLEIATQQSPQVRLLGIGIVPELKRREKDLSKLDDDHPLKPLIVNCLKDDPKQRPNTVTLQRKLQDLIVANIYSIDKCHGQVTKPLKGSPENAKCLVSERAEGCPETLFAPGTVVVAKHQFKGSATYDLPFRKGDCLTIVNTSLVSNWYKARSEDGLEGMIPANFVKVKAEALTVKKDGQKNPSEASQDSLPKTAVQLHKVPWFHGKISRSESESKLQAMQNGLFLVRESNNFPGYFNISVCFDSKIEHYHIKFIDNMYTIDDEKVFENLTQMVEHYQKDADGLVTRLWVPVAKGGKQKYLVEMNDFKKNGWNISRDKLELGDTIGKGEFTKVFSGKYKGEKVAIKLLKDNHKGLQEFLVEASVMTSLSHPNLVNLIGVSVDQKPVCIITEFMKKGSLLDFLWSRGRSVIQRSHQIGFAQDVVNGMAYLEYKDLVHRNLAARNILVSEDIVAKVSDFALTRESDYDTKGFTLPIKWTAPEAIEFAEFSNKSDVWSFGILMWEVYSFGRVPYPRVPISDIMAHIKSGGRLELPDNCPPEVYSIMNLCWHEKPEERPTFSDIKKELKALPASVGKP